MASNDLLTVGSIKFEDYVDEIATITNVDAKQLLEFDEKEIANLGKSFGKEIFHKIAPKRIEKIITNAEETFHDVVGICSSLQMLAKNNEKTEETIKNIEEKQV